MEIEIETETEKRNMKWLKQWKPHSCTNLCSMYVSMYIY